MKSINPFPTKDYIAPEYFCDREKETAQLIESIHNHRDTTIVSQRKIGKTALIKHVFHSLKNEKDLSIHYFDIYPTQNLRDFTNMLCNALIGYFESKPEKLLQRFVKLLGQFRPRFTLDEFTGRPAIELDLQTETEMANSLAALFGYLSKQERKVVLAIDEFQQITQYPETNVEALLRTHLQECKNVVMIYSGSNRHMLTSLFNDYARPFYQSSGYLFLGNLEQGVYQDFISGHFGWAGRTVTEPALDYLMDWTLGITYYVQEVCNRLYAAGSKKNDQQEIKDICFRILEERTPLYLVFRDLLTRQQFDLLVALAREVYTSQPGSMEFIRKHELGAVSTVNRSLEALLNKSLVFSEDGRYTLPDVFLLRWLRHYF